MLRFLVFIDRLLICTLLDVQQSREHARQHFNVFIVLLSLYFASSRNDFNHHNFYIRQFYKLYISLTYTSAAVPH